MTTTYFLGLLVALPTIAFTIEKGFLITAFARWHQKAGDAYSDLRDEFYFKKLTIEEALSRKFWLDRRLRAEQPFPRLTFEINQVKIEPFP